MTLSFCSRIWWFAHLSQLQVCVWCLSMLRDFVLRLWGGMAGWPTSYLLVWGCCICFTASDQQSPVAHLDNGVGGGGYFSWHMHSGLSFRFPRHTLASLSGVYPIQLALSSFWLLSHSLHAFSLALRAPAHGDTSLVAIADAGWQEQLVLPRWWEWPGPFPAGEILTSIYFCFH